MIWQTGNNSLMLEQSMRFLWTKQTALLDNISNVETPGYKAKYVTFEETLRSRLGGDRSGPNARAQYRETLQNATPLVHVAQDESTRLDENSVNITDQFIEVSRNAYQLQYAMTAINTDYSTLRAAIRG